ncbi:hypothetical protein UFOVP73_10 [uncultured Caudovirales phage]|uniref:Uncharacterized protein n=1 Tax=uncultured Caudovirales phage TaxID=2100421 RepID=A0A6J5KXX2_9CAUD|nr:hypothetical protein UFOVP73_10 [uncultured Caudovirales phage]CAB5194917.1 hypothetical protein UFOVP170_32 [uncultured Caudovirales phage]
MDEHRSKIENATAAIACAARRNKNITAAGLLDECQRGDFAGWTHLSAVGQCNASQISAALTAAAAVLLDEYEASRQADEDECRYAPN